MIVVLVELTVELESSISAWSSELSEAGSYQIQHRYFHHTLVEVGSSIFDDFHCHNFLGFEVLTFYHLSKGALAKNIED